MMRVHVAVRDSGAAGDLIRMLLEQLDAETIRFDAEQRQVCVEERGADRALVRTLDVVEDWVTQMGVPTTVEVDGRSYTLHPADRSALVR
jgi:hypothetical protein